jgi:hypothetical protein
MGREGVFAVAPFVVGEIAYDVQRPAGTARLNKRAVEETTPKRALASVRAERAIPLIP